MKKVNIIFLSLLVLILVTGCGTTEDKEEKLVCTTTEKEDGMSVEEVISMTYKNDKLKRMTMEVNTTITDTDIKENWQEFKKHMDESNEEFNKDGVSLKVEVNDQNYEYNTILDIDIENASEDILKEQGFEGLKNDKSTLKDSKKSAEEDGATCEIKPIK